MNDESGEPSAPTAGTLEEVRQHVRALEKLYGNVMVQLVAEGHYKTSRMDTAEFFLGLQDGHPFILDLLHISTNGRVSVSPVFQKPE